MHGHHGSHGGLGHHHSSFGHHHHHSSLGAHHSGFHHHHSNNIAMTNMAMANMAALAGPPVTPYTLDSFVFSFPDGDCGCPLIDCCNSAARVTIPQFVPPSLEGLYTTEEYADFLTKLNAVSKKTVFPMFPSICCHFIIPFSPICCKMHCGSKRENGLIACIAAENERIKDKGLFWATGKYINQHSFMLSYNPAARQAYEQANPTARVLMPNNTVVVQQPVGFVPSVGLAQQPVVVQQVVQQQPMGQPPVGYPPQQPVAGYPPQQPPVGYPPQPPAGYPPQPQSDQQPPPPSYTSAVSTPASCKTCGTGIQQDTKVCPNCNSAQL